MFDYFGVLISVIFGLALTHLLRGLGRLIHLRHETRPYWLHIFWTINVINYVLALWWGMYWWRGLQDWTFGWFMFVSGYAIAVFMWSYVLYPAEFPAGVDFEAYFFANRRWFFGIQAICVLWDIPETLQKAVMHLRPLPGIYWYFIASLVLICIIGLLTDKRPVHAALCIAWFLLMLGYEFLSSVGRIAARFA